MMADTGMVWLLLVVVLVLGIASLIKYLRSSAAVPSRAIGLNEVPSAESRNGSLVTEA